MYIFLVSLSIFLLDRLSKCWVVNNFKLGESIAIIDGYFNFTYILNYGAAFGILEHKRWIFLAIVIFLLAATYHFRKRINEYLLIGKTGVGLILGGALGNAYDRFFDGGVIDFFDFIIWPIFNVADIAICLGVLFIAIEELELLKKEF